MKNKAVYICNSCNTVFRKVDALDDLKDKKLIFSKDKQFVVIKKSTELNNIIANEIKVPDVIADKISPLDMHWLSQEEFDKCGSGWYFVKSKKSSFPKKVLLLTKVENIFGYMYRDKFKILNFKKHDFAGPIPLPR